MGTRHTVQVEIRRSDRELPLVSAPVEIEGQDYDLFDGTQARELLLSSGRLTLGADWVSIGEHVVPARHVDLISVRINSKARDSKRDPQLRVPPTRDPRE